MSALQAVDPNLETSRGDSDRHLGQTISPPGGAIPKAGQLLQALWCDPVAAPRRLVLHDDIYVIEARGPKRGAQVIFDLPHGRTSRICGCDGRNHPVPVDANIAQDPELGDAEHGDLGINDTRRHGEGPVVVERWWRSPCQPRMTALHPLRLGEKRPEMLGVKATAAAASLIGIVGNSKVGFVQDLPDAFLPVIAIPRCLSFGELGRVSPKVVDRGLRPTMGLVGAVTEADHPGREWSRW